MNSDIGRREMLGRTWKVGAGLMGAAGLWTTWDLLQPLPTSDFGGQVRAGTSQDVPEAGALEVRAAKAYLVRLEGDVVALSEKCPHLGCRVAFCDPSNRFECPCHGSVFNRAGELLAGPSPRGLDRYRVELGDDGMLYIDTSAREEGPPPGVETIDESGVGDACTSDGDP